MENMALPLFAMAEEELLQLLWKEFDGQQIFKKYKPRKKDFRNPFSGVLK